MFKNPVTVVLGSAAGCFGVAGVAAGVVALGSVPVAGIVALGLFGSITAGSWGAARNPL
uniref:Uncharacterized protein n=1 Tax=Chryseobacterium endophyticum TaxID=1854762 RepID=A0AAU6WQQ1_9FLAO